METWISLSAVVFTQVALERPQLAETLSQPARKPNWIWNKVGSGLGAGLITDAKAIDWDLDQDMDLVLSSEWGSLQLWEKGRDGYVNRTQEAGLDVRKGMWMVLEAGDLDGDGDMDLIAGNWGRNTDYQKHLHHPIRLYHGDLDKDGRYDVLESYYDQSLKDWVPARDLVALGNAFGFVRQRYRRYADVAALSMTELFDGISSLEQWLEMQHLESGIWWNESDHFQWQALPFAARWAPVQSIAVMDWNDDGRPGSLFGAELSIPQPAFSLHGCRAGLLNRESRRKALSLPFGRRKWDSSLWRTICLSGCRLEWGWTGGSDRG